nr:MAG TPA: hypothetical protein [Caudoviricetes sp.]
MQAQAEAQGWLGASLHFDRHSVTGVSFFFLKKVKKSSQKPLHLLSRYNILRTYKRKNKGASNEKAYN